MRQALGLRWVRWTVPLALAAAVGAVLVATLASPNKASADVVIAGARSISDPVLIAYGVKKQGTTTDVHVLAFNDLHGNLEAAGDNITATSQGARPTSRRRSRTARPSTVARRRRRPFSQATTSVQPACVRALLRGADHRREQPDEGRLRLGRQP